MRGREGGREGGREILLHVAGVVGHTHPTLLVLQPLLGVQLVLYQQLDEISP